jgi:hypothetical protein
VGEAFVCGASEEVVGAADLLVGDAEGWDF